MKIIEYDNKYEKDIKDLLVELQEHIVNLDPFHYNILTSQYREKYFEKTINEIEQYEGKIFLACDNDKIVGLIIGLINNDTETSYDFQVPKRGRITELIVSKKCQSKGIGKLLLTKMESYLKSVGCEDILIGVFAYNEQAYSFYCKNGYENRMLEMTKKL